MSRFAVRDFEYRELSDFTGRLSSTLLHIKKEMDGYPRSESVVDEEMMFYREYLADVLATIKGMIEANDPESFRHEVQKDVIPTSVFLSLKDKWDKDSDEKIGQISRAVARLQDPDFDVQIENLEIAEEVLKVSSDLTTEVFQRMHGIG
jgi:hypothetical protein